MSEARALPAVPDIKSLLKKIKQDHQKTVQHLDHVFSTIEAHRIIPVRQPSLIEEIAYNYPRIESYRSTDPGPTAPLQIREFLDALGTEPNRYRQDYSAFEFALMERQKSDNALEEADRDIALGRFAGPPDCPGSLMDVVGLPTISETAFEHLQPILLPSTYTNKVHIGRYILLRVLAKPFMIIGYTFIVSDPSGHSAILQLDELLETPLSIGTPSYEDVCALLPIGSIVAVKEPRMIIRKPSNRPSIIPGARSEWLIIRSGVPLSDSLVKGVSWVEADGTPWIPTEEHLGFEGWREKGNKLFVAKKYLQAHIAYTQAILQESDHPSIHLLHLNRATTCLYLERYDQAVKDAAESLKHFPVHSKDKRLVVKAMDRMGKGLAGLRRWKMAHAIYALMADRQLDPEIATRGMALMQKRIQEQTTGSYDFLDLYKHSDTNPLLRHQIAYYMGPIEVYQHPRYGRSLRSTADLKAGDLVMVTAALASAFPAEQSLNRILPHFSHDDSMIMPSVSAMLRHQTWYTWRHNESSSEQIKQLSAGDEFQTYPSYPLLSEQNSSPPVAISPRRLTNIIGRNGFKTLALKDRDAPKHEQASALFGPSSMFINDCRPNTSYYHIGNLQIWRTLKDLPAGSTLTNSYGASRNHSQRAAGYIRNFGFECDCRICVAERADGKAIIAKRERLLEEIKAIEESTAGMRRMEVKLSALKATYGPQHGVVKFDLAKALFIVSQGYIRLSVLTGGRDKSLIDLAMKRAIAAFIADGCEPNPAARTNPKAISVLPRPGSPNATQIALHMADMYICQEGRVTAAAKAWLQFARASDKTTEADGGKELWNLYRASVFFGCDVSSIL